MKQKIGNRIRTTAITLAAAAGFFASTIPYGNALAQNPRIDRGLNSTMGYLSKIPEQPVLGESLDNFLAGRLDESENPLYWVRKDESDTNGVGGKSCSASDDEGTFFGRIDEYGECKPPE